VATLVLPSGRRAHRFGVSTPHGPRSADELAAVTMLLGRRPSMLLWYNDFESSPPMAELAAAAAFGAEPVITWEPWRWSGTAHPPTPVSLADIAAGAFDGYIAQWGDALARWPHRVLLRFAHEFDGDWYPWGAAGGTTPQQYVAAWRHVHDALRARGAEVTWVWNPSAAPGPPPALVDWYPGDDYVDALGIDGYNWGTSQPWSEWHSPAEIFDPVVAALREVGDDLPLLFAEVGCAEAGGDKGAWISEFAAYLTRLAGEREVWGFVWFDHDKETDWRLASSPAAAAAMSAALAEVSG
jgi:mannan endo-1,4-beta-mannosidase